MAVLIVSASQEVATPHRLCVRLCLIFFQDHGHGPEQTLLTFGQSGMNATRDDRGIVSRQLHSGCPSPHARIFTRWSSLMAHTQETPEPKP